MIVNGWVLEPDEKLLWSGRPALLRFLRQRLHRDFIGGLVLLGILTAAYMSSQTMVPVAFLEIAPLISGAHTVFRLGRALWESRRTFYALTDRRALIEVGVETHTITIADGRSIRVRSHRNGTGDIVFGEKWVSDGESRWITEEGFIAVKDVAAVEPLVRAMMASHADGARPEP